MRKLDTILIHCSATAEGKNFTEKDIDAWHRMRGFCNGIGYNYVVLLDGTVREGRSLDIPGAHCPQENMNRRAIGICYIGGLEADGKTPKDTRTPEQKKAISELIVRLKRQFPEVKQVRGHRDVKGVAKACPCFDAIQEYQHLVS